MRRPNDLHLPYMVDLAVLEGPLGSLNSALKERIRNQLAAIAELAAIMPPPVPLHGLGPHFDAYSLRIDSFTLYYSVDPLRRRIILRDVSAADPTPHKK